MRESNDILELMRAKEGGAKSYQSWDKNLRVIRDINGYRVQLGLFDGKGETLPEAFANLTEHISDESHEPPPF